MENKQVLQQLSDRAQACLDHSGKALHAGMDTVLLVLAVLFGGLASCALLLMAVLGNKPREEDVCAEERI